MNMDDWIRITSELKIDTIWIVAGSAQSRMDNPVGACDSEHVSNSNLGNV